MAIGVHTVHMYVDIRWLDGAVVVIDLKYILYMY